MALNLKEEDNEKNILIIMLGFVSFNILASEQPQEVVEQEEEEFGEWSLQSEADPLPGHDYSYTDRVFPKKKKKKDKENKKPKK